MRRIPIKRNNMFYGEEDFIFETEIGVDYIETDVNQSVILYQVDRNTTLVDDFYGEAKKGEISFLPPVELPCLYSLDRSENKSYDNNRGLGRYINLGKLVFNVYISTLKEYDADIKYGDYIGVVVSEDKIEYFTVVNDGRKDYDNRHTMNGYKNFYRTIECVYVDPNEFNGM